jgi:hypothetical protein
MGNLYIRAIETKEDIAKVIGDEFTPGLITHLGLNKRVKFEMRKMKKIGKKCKYNDVIEVKFCNKVIHCKIKDIEIEEITGSVSWIELENVSKAIHTKKKIPLVFKNTESLSKDLKVCLTEVDISGKNEDLPDFISIDLKDVKQKEFKISNLKIDTGLKVMNKKDDIIALIKSKPYYYVS